MRSDRIYRLHITLAVLVSVTRSAGYTYACDVQTDRRAIIACGARLRPLYQCPDSGNNEVVVACLVSGSSRCPDEMCLLRSLFFICAHHNFAVTAVHVPGVSNQINNLLSCANLQASHKLVLAAKTHPDMVIPFPEIH